MKYLFDHFCQKTSPVETDEVLTIACPNEKLLTHYFKKSVILYIICRDLVQNVNIVIDLFSKEFFNSLKKSAEGLTVRRPKSDPDCHPCHVRTKIKSHNL